MNIIFEYIQYMKKGHILRTDNIFITTFNVGIVMVWLYILVASIIWIHIHTFKNYRIFPYKHYFYVIHR